MTALHDAVEASRSPVDVALVTHGEVSYAAAQQSRTAVIDDGALWAEVSAWREDVLRLADLASSERLVLFLGAGVSAAAGMPTWTALLTDLASCAGLSPQERIDPRTAPLSRPSSDHRARTGKQALREFICRRFAHREVSLSHQLLASLPVSEVATTNYDDRFESAWSRIRGEIAVLPKQTIRDQKRWLLKLHGSIDDSDRIVLSRSDYLNFTSDRSALAGIVQAMLITRHMLFVGFSLNDDNLHRILHEVRTTIGQPAERPGEEFATAISSDKAPLARELWHRDIDVLQLVADGDQPPAAWRRVETFLDALAAHTTNTAGHLLDPTFSGVRGHSEAELIGMLKPLLEAPEHVRATVAWGEVARMLARLGGTTL